MNSADAWRAASEGDIIKRRARRRKEFGGQLVTV